MVSRHTKTNENKKSKPKNMKNIFGYARVPLPQKKGHINKIFEYFKRVYEKNPEKIIGGLGYFTSTSLMGTGIYLGLIAIKISSKNTIEMGEFVKGLEFVLGGGISGIMGITLLEKIKNMKH